ncbi:Transcription elongation factor GreA [hydrothermal vent metagenome]|uniref:Transcription elongation factor GreA n=1 Tax=hydrothermal vent metagenome TaxID=652676 RepID=A0A3B1DNI1_9ZZZZ
MADVYLTRVGFQKLYDKLEQLKKNRLKIADAIEEARLQGDLSENAEYDAAKEAQAHNAAQMAELEGVLSGVKFVEDQNIPADKIYIGATVSLKDLDSGKKLKYTLLSPEEVDFQENGLSIYSPVGKGLTGLGEGEEVEIEVPVGKLRYKVLKITRP